MAEFHKVLVANRGEIARRIFRTLRQMGIATVAVFSDADDDALHVAEADEAVRLGPAPSAHSYLDQEAVIAAAEEVGAEAIHPGYGFLAENAAFAARCAEAGLIFIGPSPETIRLMGDKAAAKALAADIGVPVLEGFSLHGLDRQTIHRRTKALGFPLLVKAVAGGGGKGMRTVSTLSDLDEALEAAAREAEGAFGNGALLVERLLPAPRHVEVQVLGDHHGRIVHCFERDCTLQRRHQKVFEEAPSPAVDAALRARLGAAAVALARAVDYLGAGTVEFLLTAGGEFFFLEMNTRLQVEHPVTEAVTGLDLVRLQIEVAQGLHLCLEQADLVLTGHAIEARLYAEDPAKDFLPATGTVALWAPPRLPGLRIDGGVKAGDTVGIHYDPLLAKIIAHGRDRGEAMRRLQHGLAELAVGGLTTNRELLLTVLEHEAFRRGEVDTAFLEALPAVTRVRPLDPAVLTQHAIAATLYLFHQRRQGPQSVPPGVLPGWRNNRWRPQEQAFTHTEGQLTVRYVARSDDRFTVEVKEVEVRDAEVKDAEVKDAEVKDAGATDGGQAEASGLDARLVEAQEELLVIEVESVRRRFRIGRSQAGFSVHGMGRVCELAPLPRFPPRQAAAVAGGCAAPMTGRITAIPVAVGDAVTAGTTLVVLEAMKMEHRLQAQADGVVEEVRVEVGQMVDPDEVLIVVSSGEEEAVSR